MSRCIGFGPFDSRRGAAAHCPNDADTPAGLWCQRCEALRREKITADMAKITATFAQSEAD